MNLFWLTRIPGLSMPREALTGNSVLDDHLRALDKLLIGSAGVRLLTLAEVRDHLQEHFETLRDSGVSHDQAAEDAVRRFPPADVARSQRLGLLRRAAVLGLSSGTPWGLFMWLFMSTMNDGRSYGESLAATWKIWLTGAACFGFAFGWIMAFAIPMVRVGQRLITDGDSFVVGTGKLLRGASILMVLGFAGAGAMSVCLAIVGLADESLSESLAFDPLWWLGLGFMSLASAWWHSRLLCRRFVVSTDGFEVHDLPGVHRKFTWSQVRKVGLLGEGRPWVPASWKRVPYVQLQRPGRRPFGILILHSMQNAARFHAMLLQQDKEAQVDR